MMPDLTAQTIVRLHAHISGRVQGVGYRAFAKRVASEAGLRGGVRNLPDGRVEVHAEGDRNVVEAFLAQLRTGPTMARVDTIAVQWERPTGHETDFRIW